MIGNFTGHHHTEETKLKLSIMKKGIHPKTEFKKGSAGFTGKHTEETKWKMHLAKMGKPSPRKGVIVSNLSKLRMSLSAIGKHTTSLSKL